MDPSLTTTPPPGAEPRRSRATLIGSLVGIQLILIGLVVAVVQALETGPDIPAGAFSISYAGPLLVAAGVAVVGMTRVLSSAAGSAEGRPGLLSIGRTVLGVG
ncbi:MAG: hypothetical protein ACR2N7_06095, partial [Acidimicrobiia bacterium]